MINTVANYYFYVAGYSKEELMSDILTQFENHLHLLHTDI